MRQSITLRFAVATVRVITIVTSFCDVWPLMILSRRMISPVSLCLLASYTLLICGGVWAPPAASPAAQGKSDSPSFACQGKGCGCMTAKQCNENCCCKRGRSRQVPTKLAVSEPSFARFVKQPQSTTPATPVFVWKSTSCRGLSVVFSLCSLVSVPQPVLIAPTHVIHAPVTEYDCGRIRNPIDPPPVPPA